MSTTKTGFLNGNFQFTGLPAGQYLITPSTQNDFDVFSPPSYTLNVEHNISNLRFYAGQDNRSPVTPPGPDIDSDSDGSYTISGRVTVEATNFPISNLTVTCARLGDVGDGESTLPAAEAPQPDATFRIVPSGLLAHKQGVQQSTCYCWAVFPENGDPEGYTSLDQNIDLPSYDSPPGQDDEVFTTPAMTYLSATGVSPTAIPTRLDLGEDGIEVTVLQFDRDKLLRNYYLNATFEVFEINYRGDLTERIIWASGLLGGSQIGDLSASIQLSLWTDVANRNLGREYSPLCDVGRLNEFPNEEFGAGRCRNAALNDGPLKADWTVEATLVSVDATYGRMQFSVTHGTTSLNSTTLNSVFDDHLAEGVVLFMTGGNTGIVRDVKAGGNNGSSVDVQLHVPLPFTPVVGDVIQLTGGCRKTPEDCQFFNNFANFRGFNVPGPNAVQRRFS